MEENEKNIPAAPVSGVENDGTKADPTTETPAAAPAQAAAPAAQPATPAGESAEKPAAAAPALMLLVAEGKVKHPLAPPRVPRHPNPPPNLLSTRLNPKSWRPNSSTTAWPN